MELKGLINEYGIEKGTLKSTVQLKEDKLFCIKLEPYMDPADWHYDVPMKIEPILLAFHGARLSDLPRTPEVAGQKVQRLEAEGENGIRFVCEDIIFLVEADSVVVETK